MSQKYDTLDDVPWNSVPYVALGPSKHNEPERVGDLVGLDAQGFAAWKTGPRKGVRIPLDAHGPWLAAGGAV